MAKTDTKLTRDQKEQLKAFKRCMGESFAFAACGAVTLLVHSEGPNTVRVSTAVCAADESKNRPKVGEWLCMTRMMNGGTSVVVPFPGPAWGLREYATYLAATFD